LPAVRAWAQGEIMRRDIALAGFVMTGDEWDGLDESQRAQLLMVALRNDGPWIAAVPVRAREPRDVADAYEAYELVLA
jgi:hypothetical protein